MIRQSRALAVDVKIEADRTARKLAAFDDLLKAAEAVLRSADLDARVSASARRLHMSMSVKELRAAVAKAKEAQK